MKVNVVILFSCIVSLGTACSHQFRTTDGAVLYNPEQNNNNNYQNIEDKSITPISDIKKNRWEYNRDLNDTTFIQPNNNIQKKDYDMEQKLENAIQKAYNNNTGIEKRTINEQNKVQKNNSNNVKSDLYIQVGLYKYLSGATKIKNKIVNSGINNVQILEENGQYRVIIGSYKNKNLADDTMEKLENIGINDYFWIKR